MSNVIPKVGMSVEGQSAGGTSKPEQFRIYATNPSKTTFDLEYADDPGFTYPSMSNRPVKELVGIGDKVIWNHDVPA